MTSDTTAIIEFDSARHAAAALELVQGTRCGRTTIYLEEDFLEVLRLREQGALPVCISQRYEDR